MHPLHARYRRLIFVVLLSGLLVPAFGCDDALHWTANRLDTIADALDDLADDRCCHDDHNWLDDVLDDIEDWFD